MIVEVLRTQHIILYLNSTKRKGNCGV